MRETGRGQVVLDRDLAGPPVRARVGGGDVPGERGTVRVPARPGDMHLFDAAATGLRR